MRVVGPISLTTAGSNGSATGSAITTIPISGEIEGVYVKIPSSPGANNVVTIRTSGSQAPALTILTLTHLTTSAWYWPTIPWQDAAGAAVTYDGTHGIMDEPPVDDFLEMDVATADPSKVFEAWFLVNEE